MRQIKLATGFLFILLLSVGLWQASQRPLWNDEYYSLIRSTLDVSYQSIWQGRVNEGNNSPLFYALQKLQCDIFSYHAPHDWLDGKWYGAHVLDRVFLRVQSVIWMAVAACALFYYFCRRYSWWAGLYALAVAMTSSLFWFHWTEARPYAAWFSLSVFQILFLLDILEHSNSQDKKNWFCLSVVHCLLALTSSVSIVQIIAAGIAIGFFIRPRLFWYIFIIVAPLGINYFYYVHAPHYKFFFVDGPLALINANIPKDRLFIIFGSAVILFYQYRKQGISSSLEIKYLTFLMLMLGAFSLVLLKLKLGQTPGEQGAFQISNRYFLSLLPVGIVGTVVFSIGLVRAFPSRVGKIAVLIILAICMAFRFYKWMS